MDTLVICPHCEKMNRVPLKTAEQKQPVCGNCKMNLPVHHGVQELTSRTLNLLVQKSSRPVVVDFWAPWCGPCRMFASTFQTAAQKNSDRIVFAKLNTENEPEAGQQFQIQSIPTLMVFKDGRIVDRQSGAMPLDSFLSYLSRF